MVLGVHVCLLYSLKTKFNTNWLAKIMILYRTGFSLIYLKTKERNGYSSLLLVLNQVSLPD